jgi:hypothetical protein
MAIVNAKQKARFMKFFDAAVKYGSRVLLILCASAGLTTADLAASALRMDNPQVVQDGSNNAVAVWEELVSNISLIRSSTFLSIPNTWSAPVTVSNNSFFSSKPLLGIDGLGNAVCIWVSKDTILNLNALYGAQLPSGGSWTAPTRLSKTTETVLGQYTLNVGADGSIQAVYCAFELVPLQSAIVAVSGQTNGTWNIPDLLAQGP